jgi:hypothetical protein
MPDADRPEAEADVAYDELADVYDWLVPEALLTPEGTVAAFTALVSLPPGGGGTRRKTA